MWQNGLAGYWLSTYLPNVDKCIIRNKGKSGIAANSGGPNKLMVLSISNVASAFILLLIGFSISMSVLVFELILFKFRASSVQEV